MTIRLTSKCSQGCKHCLVNATINGRDMSSSTLDNVLELIKYSNVPIIKLSGGEITEIDGWYEQILKIIQFIIDNQLITKIIILSNGTFVLDKEKLSKMKILLQSNIVIELYVSTNNTYYKDYNSVINNIDKIKSTKLRLNLYDRNEVLKNLGRAKNLNVNLNTLASCGVSRKILCKYNVKNLKEFLNVMPYNDCAPMIDVNGFIHLGWGNECVSVGNVNENSYEEIYKNILNFKPCGLCGQIIC